MAQRTFRLTLADGGCRRAGSQMGHKRNLSHLIMRRVENRPAQRASRLTAVPAAVASGPDRGWLVDTKYKPARTLMIYALLLFMTLPPTVFSQQSNAVVPEPNLLYRTLK